MFKELFNEHIIFTTLFLFIVAYIVMNLESIKKGVYITPNYINPLLISLASVVVLKLIFSLCSSSGRSKIEQIHIETYDVPDALLKGGNNKYNLNKMPKRNTFLPYE
jgi:hypothetical protein